MAGAKDTSTSPLRLVLGAASLFLFIVGVKRTFRTADGHEVVADRDVGLGNG